MFLAIVISLFLLYFLNVQDFFLSQMGWLVHWNIQNVRGYATDLSSVYGAIQIPVPGGGLGIGGGEINKISWKTYLTIYSDF